MAVFLPLLEVKCALGFGHTNFSGASLGARSSLTSLRQYFLRVDWALTGAARRPTGAGPVSRLEACNAAWSSSSDSLSSYSSSLARSARGRVLRPAVVDGAGSLGGRPNATDKGRGPSFKPWTKAAQPAASKPERSTASRGAKT